MKIYLFLSDKLLSYNIPVRVYGSFSFGEENEETENLINIEARDDRWVLYSTDDVDVLNGTEKELVMPLLSDTYYALRKDNKKYLIFVTNAFDETFTTYSYDDKINLVIGNNEECNVKINMNLVNSVIGKIAMENGQLMLSSVDVHKVFLNNRVIDTENGTCVINNGDQLNIYGFRMLFFNNILMINNPKNIVNVNMGTAMLRPYVYTLGEEPQKINVKDRELYGKDDFFSKSPRIRRLIKKYTMELASPPKTSEDGVLPVILTLGPALTMLLTSLIRIAETVEELINGKSTLAENWPTLATSILMLVSSFVWPTLSNRIMKKMDAAKRKKSYDKYTAYLEKKQQLLIGESKLQADIINDNLKTSAKCNELINSSNINFWDKRVDQNDFLEVRLGIGNQLLDADITYKKEDFTIDDDELREKADKLIETFKYIHNVPIGYSFLENKVTAIMGYDKKKYGIINNIILQLITFYSYEDIKFVIITNDTNKNRWEYTRYLNHCFSNDKSIRFLSSDFEHTRYLSGYFISIISQRMQMLSANEGAPIPFSPHFVVITDDYYQLKNTDFIKAITEIDANLGFSLIILESRLSQLPSKCNNFINLRGSQSGILKNSFEGTEPEMFMDEIDYNVDMMSVTKKLANIPIAFEEMTRELPNSISFLEMEKVGKVEQLNILNRWENNDPVHSLKAEIGVDEEGNLMYLDLHEKAHGPHGLIAGTTGSGKSEFIIT